ncbi:MAG: CDP-glycerol glycerophosphotransferase family protein, partial [Treponema sp.]|nr:CDP-glycerol glycerophosphotransferase family protein [Treponema sp.]
PSWGARSSLRTCGEDIIAGLLDAGWTVIFRPHPQSLTVDGDRLEKIRSRFRSNGRFRIDTAPSGMESMANSDIMVSDFSGVIFDYSILFGRPVLLASGGLSLTGYEAEDLPPELLFNVPVTKRITRELTENDIPHIAEIVEEELASSSGGRAPYTVPNLGHAGEKVYEVVSKIWEGLE